MKILIIAIAAVLGIQSLSASTEKTTYLESSVETIIGKHTIRFTTPPKRIPNQCSVDAPLLGNGFTGIALSGNLESQVFYVARNDFGRLKSALDESFPPV
ncbi:MAG: hypothetical protein PHG06_21085 [Parabacteroides sp.]|nr:hypothetical protein [Parabacteroides sp.]